METGSSQINIVSLEEQMKDAYLEYAMSVIVGRALPDARDGLKPVHRRILFSMYDSGTTHDKPYRKSARIVGDVIGKYHPHGDMAVYETMVRLAQNFSMRYPLIDGQGNFGSVDGDSAAAMRYTEVRLENVAEDLLSDLDKDTVDFLPNYDNSTFEPVVLPTKIPNLLVNGSSGIAVGMATSIPPHNLREVIDALKAVIENPEIDALELFKIIPGPDFPTAGFIYGKKGLKEAYTTGKGIIYIRAKAETEDFKNERERIVVTEIPYQVSKAKLIEHVAELVHEGKIDGISDIRDESDRKGMRIVFDLKKGENSQIILNQLFKNTQMQVSYGIIMLALDHQQPKLMNIKELLVAFLSHRKEVVTRRTTYELKKAEEKAHILEALKKAVGNLDEVISLIRKAESPLMAQARLIEKYEFSEVQAKAILEMRLQRLTGLEREKIVADYNETIKLISGLKEILADEKKVVDIIVKELGDIREAFGDERKTKFIEMVTELKEEDLITDESMVVTATISGYIKRLPVDTYRSQRRGGKGIIGAGTKEEDFIWDVFVASTHDYILVFTNRGKVHWLKVHQIPEAGRAARGKPIVNLLEMEAGEKIQAILPVQNLERENVFVTMVTSRGIIKKTTLISFSRPMRKGIIALSIDEGDSLIEAMVTNGEQHIILVTKSGQSIRFDEQDIRAMGRTARGVQGMRLSEDDEVIGMTIVTPDEVGTQLLTVTEKGFGKRTPIEEYRAQGRGGSGIRTMRVTEKNGPVIAVRHVINDDEIIIASDHGKVIRTKVSEISEVGRIAQGVMLIDLAEGEKVGAVAKLVEKDDE